MDGNGELSQNSAFLSKKLSELFEGYLQCEISELYSI